MSAGKLALRLEVGADDGDLVNLFRNPIGLEGASGWYFPVGSVTSLNLGAGVTFDASPSLAPANSEALSHRYPLTPGRWFTARVEVGEVAANAVRLAVDYYTATGDLARSQTRQVLVAGVNHVTPVEIPAGCVMGRLTLIFNNPQTTGWDRLQLSYVAATEGPTRAAVTTIPRIGLRRWRTVTDRLNNLRIRRAELDVGTLEATIRDTALASAVSPALRGGQPLRLAITPAAGDLLDDALFTGTILTSPTVYELLNKDQTTRARVDLTAVDHIAHLAAAPTSPGTRTISGLGAVLARAEANRTDVNTTTTNRVSPPTTADTVGYNDPEATALTQLVLTRDSTGGYVWVTRDNRVAAYEAARMPTDPVGTLTEDDYGADIDVSLDLDTVINAVTVVLRRVNAATGQVVEVPYGPFRREASIAAYGLRATTVTVHGVTETTAALKAVADRVLDANDTPRMRVNSLSLGIRTTADLRRHKSHLELYDLVRVVNPSNGLDQTLRVTSIDHDIDFAAAGGAGLWTMRVGFATAGSVATPIQVPAAGTPAAAVSYDQWTPLELRSGFKSVDADAVVAFKINNGVLFLRGRVERADGVSLAATTDHTVGDLPADITIPLNERMPTTAANADAVSSVLLTSSTPTTRSAVAVRSAVASRFVHVRGSTPL